MKDRVLTNEAPEADPRMVLVRYTRPAYAQTPVVTHGALVSTAEVIDTAGHAVAARYWHHGSEHALPLAEARALCDADTAFGIVGPVAVPPTTPKRP